MPSRDWRLRVRDILDAIAAIEQRIASISFNEFENDRTIVKAVLYDFIIIGEATRNIPTEIKSHSPLVPWRLMAGMRNVVSHEYFQVNLSRIWQTIQEDLPPLVPQLQEILARQEK